MRIGVVTSSYPRHEGDHAGSFVAAHVGAMRSAGHDVDVVRAPASSLLDGGAPDALERGGWRTYADAARITAQLTAEVTRRARGWDLVIAHWLVPSAIAALPSAMRASPRVPLLAIAHGGDVHTLRRLHLLESALFALAARGAGLAFVTSELRDIARAAAPRVRGYVDRALVQPMGFDLVRFAAIASARRAAAAQRLREEALPPIVVVARLVPVKGVDVAIAAHRRLADRDGIAARAELVIAGDGPERASLEALARSARARRHDHAAPLPTSPLVRFLGAVDATARDHLLARAAVVVIPSRVLANGRTEGAPLIALEALAAGVPVVASAVGGLRDLAGHHGITLVPPEDPSALAAAIDAVLAAESIAPAHRTEATNLASYDWQRVASRLLAHVGFTDSKPVCEPLEAPGKSSSHRGA